MSGNHEGWLGLQLGNFEQWFTLVAQRRPFGGRQRYFMCPVLNRPVSVLWRPPGARDFRSRQAWGRQVAYASQFSDRINRAHLGKSRIKRRLIADLDPDKWDVPPKPKWMRWSTYNRYVERYDKYEAFLNYGCAAALDRLLGKISFEK
jgi:hypothetical protein